MLENKEIRLILSPKSSAKKNMAIDKALVNSFKIEESIIFRVYSWEKSFTVGIGQDLDNYKEFKEQYNNNCSKRITGGGVLFHGHDISYSLLVPSVVLGNLGVKESYEKICQFLLQFYKDLGLKPSFVKDNQEISLMKSDFCQVGFEAYDILVNGKKIGGNAQKRTSKLIFQHGSIPLNKTDDSSLMGTTLEDIGIVLDIKEAQKKLVNAFEKCFSVNYKVSQLTEIEEENLNKILEGK
jgi:lipoate-protein ligase A